MAALVRLEPHYGERQGDLQPLEPSVLHVNVICQNSRTQKQLNPSTESGAGGVSSREICGSSWTCELRSAFKL